jgi:DNA-binding CsgD family transcriptional regulator
VEAWAKRQFGDATGSQDTVAGLISRAPALTAAELEVLKWIRLGKTNREIGKLLDRSEFTIKTHVAHMLEKAGVGNRIQLCAAIGGSLQQDAQRSALTYSPPAV